MELTIVRGDPTEAMPTSGSLSGYGYGSGDGYGSGSGYGSGYGYGSGDGDGYGDGYGYGYGDGYGSGDGYGYWLAVLHQHPSAKSAIESGATIAFWKSDKNGAPANSGSGTVASVGLVEELPGPLRDTCGKGQLHATLNPMKWDGCRWWIVALHGPIREDTSDSKIWGLKREFLAEVTDWFVRSAA